jgi:hypothetical protein
MKLLINGSDTAFLIRSPSFATASFLPCFWDELSLPSVSPEFLFQRLSGRSLPAFSVVSKAQRFGDAIQVISHSNPPQILE